MNSSLALIQKVRNIALAGTGSFSEGVINYPLLAYPLNADDFTFLQDNLKDTAENAQAYWSSKYQFALLANSVPSRSFIWNLDPGNLLYDNYKKVLSDALLIAPGELSAEEKLAFDIASKTLFTPSGDDTTGYIAYKKFSDKDIELQNAISDIQLEINKSLQIDSQENKTLTDNLNLLQEQLDENGLKWISVGNKLEIENAKNILNSIRKKDEFVKKWQSEKNWMNEDSNAKNTQDEENANFFETSCSPNDFFQPDSKSWQKFELNKNEIEDLIAQYQKEVSDDITEQFGNLDVKLESIKFEICLLSIIRNWFKPDLLFSKLWKLPAEIENLSLGENDFTGSIPCYPVKIILIKNVSFELSEDKINDDLQNNIKTGVPLFLANLLIKTPATTASFKSLSPQTLSANQFKNIAFANNDNTKVAPQKRFTKLNAFQTLGFKKIKSSVAAGHFKSPAVHTAATAAVHATFKSDHPAAIPIPPAKHGGGTMLKKKFQGPILMEKAPTHEVAQPEEKKFNLSGTVTDDSNNPLSNVEVSIQRLSDAALQTVLTANTGGYAFQNMIPGNYHVRFSKEEFKNKEIDISLNADNTSNISLEADKQQEEYFVIAVMSKKLPKLPDPIPGATYV